MYSAAVILGCLYVPFCWLIFESVERPQYQMSWVKIWRILPGFIPVARSRLPEKAEIWAMGLVTAVMVMGLFWICGRGRKGLVWGAVLSLAVSLPTSYVTYMIFRW